MSFLAMSVAAVMATAGPCGGTKSAEGGCGSYEGGAQIVRVANYHDTKNIVETAAAAGQFNTLLAAAKAAGLAPVLAGEGPFTVFAPTDEAFAKLPAGTVESLLKPENKGLLTAILTYHVAPGKLDSSAVASSSFLGTVNGQRVAFTERNGSLMIDGAKIIKADIEATNGTIHVIDSVIMPSTNDLIDTAVEAGSFTTLAAAIKAAGLVETLQGEGPFTVFAPTDEAFANLPAGTVETLLKPENREKLRSVLLYHVVPGRVYASDVVKLRSAGTALGQDVEVNIVSDGVQINDARVLQTDIDATNGVIHVIDAVLIPQG